VSAALFAIAYAEILDQARQHPRNFFVLVTQMAGFVVTQVVPATSDFEVGPHFVGGAPCDEEVPSELTIALLAEPFRDVGGDSG
jgi:hypothetical protein